MTLNRRFGLLLYGRRSPARLCHPLWLTGASCRLMSLQARSALFAVLMVSAFAAWCKAQDMLRPSGSTGETSFMQSDSQFRFSGGENTSLERFAIDSAAHPHPLDVGVDFYSPPEFKGGLIIRGRDVAMKIGGYVKADFIYDFDPIDSTDSFITTTIPVGAPPHMNARFHARQTRLNVDTRWPACRETVRAFVRHMRLERNW